MKYIKRKNCKPEANIQAELYHRLKLLGIKMVLEHKVDNCKFDGIIIDENEENILALIECKNYVTGDSERWSKTKQSKKYREFMVPIILVTKEEEIHKAIEIIMHVLILKASNFDDHVKNGIISFDGKKIQKSRKPFKDKEHRLFNKYTAFPPGYSDKFNIK